MNITTDSVVYVIVKSTPPCILCRRDKSPQQQSVLSPHGLILVVSVCKQSE